MERRKRQRLRRVLGNPAGPRSSNLLTMMMSEEKSNFHMIPAEILDAQSEAIGIPIMKQQATPKTYENDFKAALRRIQSQRRRRLSHRRHLRGSWARRGLAGRVLKEVGLKPIKPLWMGDTKQIYLDYLKTGFQSNRGSNQPGEAGRGVAWAGA